MQRSVDAPDAVWSSIRAAAEWLGLTVAELRHEMQLHPDLLPVKKISKGYKLYWMDLVGYSWYRARHADKNPPDFTSEGKS